MARTAHVDSLKLTEEELIGLRGLGESRSTYSRSKRSSSRWLG